MGRAKKPASVRREEGHRGHRPIPEHELTGVGPLVEPVHLTEAQRERWREIVASLPVTLLTAADVSTIERMAVAWATFREANQVLDGKTLIRGRDGNVVRNPMLTVRKQAVEEMNLCGMTLGLSPYARTRLTHQEKEDEDDDLAVLMTSDELLARTRNSRNH